MITTLQRHCDISRKYRSFKQYKKWRNILQIIYYTGKHKGVYLTPVHGTFLNLVSRFIADLPGLTAHYKCLQWTKKAIWKGNCAEKCTFLCSQYQLTNKEKK